MLARVMQSLVFTTPNFIHKDLVHDTERIAQRGKNNTNHFDPEHMPPWSPPYSSASVDERREQFLGCIKPMLAAVRH